MHEPMKKLLLILLMALSTVASAQNYVVDNLFGKDSVLFVSGKTDKRVSAGFGARKNTKAQDVKLDSVYVRCGESVRLKEVPKDSLRLLRLLVEEVPVLYGKKTYYTLASNLRLSEDNPEGTADILTTRLKNHRYIDLHGKDRWLFSRWLVLLLLILGFAGVVLSILAGRMGRPILVIALLLMDVYIVLIGVDTATWFINSHLTSEVFSLVCLGLFLVYFALTIRLIVSLFKKNDSSSVLFAFLLILLGLPLLPLAYLIVFSVAMALLFKYWWIGAALVGLVVLLCLPDVQEGELERLRAENKKSEKQREEALRQERFERALKKNWHMGDQED